MKCQKPVDQWKTRCRKKASEPHTAEMITWKNQVHSVRNKITQSLDYKATAMLKFAEFGRQICHYRPF
jgi:hypothetical protein